MSSHVISVLLIVKLVCSLELVENFARFVLTDCVFLSRCMSLGGREHNPPEMAPKPKHVMVANPVIKERETAIAKQKEREGTGRLKTYSETLELSGLDRSGLREFTDLVLDSAPAFQNMQFDTLDAMLSHIQMGRSGVVLHLRARQKQLAQIFAARPNTTVKITPTDPLQAVQFIKQQAREEKERTAREAAAKQSEKDAATALLLAMGHTPTDKDYWLKVGAAHKAKEAAAAQAGSEAATAAIAAAAASLAASKPADTKPEGAASAAGEQTTKPASTDAGDTKSVPATTTAPTTTTGADVSKSDTKSADASATATATPSATPTVPAGIVAPPATATYFSRDLIRFELDQNAVSAAEAGYRFHASLYGRWTMKSVYTQLMNPTAFNISLANEPGMAEWERKAAAYLKFTPNSVLFVAQNKTEMTTPGGVDLTQFVRSLCTLNLSLATPTGGSIADGGLATDRRLLRLTVWFMFASAVLLGDVVLPPPKTDGSTTTAAADSKIATATKTTDPTPAFAAGASGSAAAGGGGGSGSSGAAKKKKKKKAAAAAAKAQTSAPAPATDAPK